MDAILYKFTIRVAEESAIGNDGLLKWLSLSREGHLQMVTNTYVDMKICWNCIYHSRF